MSDPAHEARLRRHQVFGWWSLALFLLLGLSLEGLQGIKAGFYLDPGHILRRELWRLAHAHGTLLALANLVIGGSLERVQALAHAGRAALVSRLWLLGSVLLPLGFLLGGAFASEHDPFIAVLLVPLGADCLIAAAVSVAWTLSRR